MPAPRNAAQANLDNNANTSIINSALTIKRNNLHNQTHRQPHSTQILSGLTHNQSNTTT